MKEDEGISPLVRRWMPDASVDELREATINFRCFLEVVYDEYRRRQATDEPGSGDDKSAESARVKRIIHERT